MMIGLGGLARVAEATGLSRNTLIGGAKEPRTGRAPPIGCAVPAEGARRPAEPHHPTPHRRADFKAMRDLKRRLRHGAAGESVNGQVVVPAGGQQKSPPLGV